MVSAFSFGISNVYWKTAQRTMGFAQLVFYRGLITTAAFGLTWLVLLQWDDLPASLIQPSAAGMDFLQTALLCFVCSLGLIFYLMSLRFTAVSIAVPLSSINIFSVLTAVVALGEVFKWVHLISLVLVVVGISLVQSFRFKRGGVLWNRGATYAMAAAFFWGITYSLFRYPAAWIGAIPLSFVLELCVTCSAFVWMQFSVKDRQTASSGTERGVVRHFFILALLLLGGTLFYNLAVQRVPILVLNITGSFTVTVSVLCGALFYKERLKPDQVVGILLLISSLLVVQIWG